MKSDKIILYLAELFLEAAATSIDGDDLLLHGKYLLFCSMVIGLLYSGKYIHHLFMSTSLVPPVVPLVLIFFGICQDRRRCHLVGLDCVDCLCLIPRGS